MTSNFTLIFLVLLLAVRETDSVPMCPAGYELSLQTIPPPTSGQTLGPTRSPTPVPSTLPVAVPSFSPTTAPTFICGAGFTNSGGSCVACSSGTYKSSPGNVGCTACSSNNSGCGGSSAGTLSCYSSCEAVPAGRCATGCTWSWADASHTASRNWCHCNIYQRDCGVSICIDDIQSTVQVPSVLPTVMRSFNPMPKPSPLPSAAPTITPTPWPVSYPTRYPTPWPVAYPTPVPTRYPTPWPVAYPTPVPTRYPTPWPVAYPTPVPTRYPTPWPVAYPTPVPTWYLPSIYPASTCYGQSCSTNGQMCLAGSPGAAVTPTGNEYANWQCQYSVWTYFSAGPYPQRALSKAYSCYGLYCSVEGQFCLAGSPGATGEEYANWRCEFGLWKYFSSGYRRLMDESIGSISNAKVDSVSLRGSASATTSATATAAADAAATGNASTLQDANRAESTQPLNQNAEIVPRKIPAFGEVANSIGTDSSNVRISSASNTNANSNATSDSFRPPKKRAASTNTGSPSVAVADIGSITAGSANSLPPAVVLPLDVNTDVNVQDILLEGTYSCELCEAGKTQPAQHFIPCAHCGLGSYAEARGAVACTSCDVGFTTIGVGSVHASQCNVCAAGFGGDGIVCTVCPNGSAKLNAGNVACSADGQREPVTDASGEIGKYSLPAWGWVVVIIAVAGLFGMFCYWCRTATKAIRVDDNIPLLETVTLSPRYILREMFDINCIECDPSSLEDCVMKLTAVLTERCQRIDSAGKEYDCFISYRVSADKDVALQLYLMLERKGLKPFLDKACLPYGEAWKTNFLKALRGSKFFVALVSTAGLAPARNHFIDHSADNVLLEYQTALAVNNKRKQDGNPQFIIPVLVGQLEGDRLTKFAPSGFALDQYSESVAARANRL